MFMCDAYFIFQVAKRLQLSIPSVHTLEILPARKKGRKEGREDITKGGRQEGRTKKGTA